MTRIICHGDLPLEVNKIYVDEIKAPDGEYKECSFLVLREATMEEYIEFAKTVEAYSAGKYTGKYIYEVEILD